MPLRLRLKPHERIIIGGAVVQNGATQVRLSVQNRVPVLRESAIMSASAVRTPCERVYFALQLMYVDAGAAGRHEAVYRQLAQDVMAAAPSCRAHFKAIDAQLAAHNPYKALKRSRALLRHERRLLVHVQ